MYGNTIRDLAYQCSLGAFLLREYGIEVTQMNPAQRGYYGETWKTVGTKGCYFVKLVYAKAYHETYAHSFAAIDHMHQHGITDVSTIIKTLTGALYSHFDSAVCGVFTWVEGANVQNRNTKFAEYRILSSVYTVPIQKLAIGRDSFGTYHAESFFRWWAQLEHQHDDKPAQRLCALFTQYQQALEARAERLAVLAKRCEVDTTHFYLTHGDAGGNIITQEDNFTLVDWDSVRIAPPERDAWFCLYWDWAMDAFNEALHARGVHYTLQPDRLAYYCYHSFFYYLAEFQATFSELHNAGMAETIEAFFQGWIAEEIAFADKMP